MKIKRLNEDYLAHHGIKGQHWGVRRYQNADGTLTAAGKARYNQEGPPPPGGSEPSPPSEPTKPSGGPPKDGESPPQDGDKPSPPEKRTVSDYEYAKNQSWNVADRNISDYEYAKYGSKGYVAEPEEPEEPEEPGNEKEEKKTSNTTDINIDDLTGTFNSYYTKVIETTKVVSEKVTEYAKSGYESLKNSSILNTTVSSIKSTVSKATSEIKSVAKDFASTNIDSIKKLFKK